MRISSLTAVGGIAALWLASTFAEGAETGGSASDSANPQEILVSARRVNESIVDVPASISVLGSADLQTLGIQSFQDYGLKIPNLSFQYGAQASGYVHSRQVSIRGIQGANTTGFYINDTQIPITLDPQVVDVQRIEVLKGPQGTLYGAGSMGGNIRIVTRSPTFTNELSYTLSAGYTTHAATPDARLVGIGNISLVDNVAALRLVAVVNHEGGFLTRTFSDRLPGPYPTPPSPLGCCESADNEGAVVNYGGSATLLVKPTEDFSLTARVLAQKEHDHGRRAQFAPLPSFKPLDGYTVRRQADSQEYADISWFLPSLELSYTGAKWSITSSTSYYGEHTEDAEDSTEGDLDAVYGVTGVILPPTCCGHHWIQPSNTYRFNQEVRVTIDEIGPFRAIVGSRYARTSSNSGYDTGAFIPGLAAAGLYPTDLAWNSLGNSVQIDKSVFGETYWRFGKFELTLGARKFWLKNENNTFANAFTDGWYNSGSFASGFVHNPTRKSSETGVSPKAALRYSVTEHSVVYASASKGFRPGGPINPPPQICAPGLAQLGLDPTASAYHSDSLWNYEVGGKTEVGKVLITAAAFQMDWTDIQQHVVIPVCYLDRILNAGDARVRGAEFEFSGIVMPGLHAALGLGYQQPTLLSGGGGLPPGSRILNVPTITGSVALTYTRQLMSNLEGFVSGDFSYTGNNTSATSGTPIQRAGYGLLNARFGVNRDRYQLQVYLKNIASREPNMGDIQLEAVNQVDANGDVLPRVAIPPPFQVGVQFTRDF